MVSMSETGSILEADLPSEGAKLFSHY